MPLNFLIASIANAQERALIHKAPDSTPQGYMNTSKSKNLERMGTITKTVKVIEMYKSTKNNSGVNSADVILNFLTSLT